jgi:hypothetical protein
MTSIFLGILCFYCCLTIALEAKNVLVIISLSKLSVDVLATIIAFVLKESQMKYIGGLLLVNVLLVAAYFLFATSVDNKRILAFTAVGVCIGVAIMLCDRLTRFRIPGLADMSSTVDQVKADANEVSAIKNRVEAQSATVDLIAKQAASTVEQLRNIACANAKATLTDLMAAKLMSGTTLKARLELHDQMIDSLKEIDVSKDKIKEAEEMWAKGVGVIYHRGIRNALEGRTQPDHVNMQASPELRQASRQFQDILHFEQWAVPTPDEMEAFIEGKGFMNDTVRELIADYRHFLETGEVRRRSVFEQL